MESATLMVNEGIQMGGGGGGGGGGGMRVYESRVFHTNQQEKCFSLLVHTTSPNYSY